MSYLNERTSGKSATDWRFEICGIIYIKDLRGRNRASYVEELFKDQIDRGTDGFGFFLPQKNKLVHNMKAGRTFRLMKKERSNDVLFHHRNPTVSSVKISRQGCHPYSTKNFFDKNYVLVHNGNITNHIARKTEHEKLGIKYFSEKSGKTNDSEALLWDLALYLEGETNEIESYGAAAYILVEMENGKPIKTHFGRNTGRPLSYVLQKTQLLISSEGFTSQVPVDKMFSYDYKTNTVDSMELKIPEYSKAWNDSWNRSLTSHRADLYPYNFIGYSITGDNGPRYFLNAGEVKWEEYIFEMMSCVLDNVQFRTDAWEYLNEQIHDLAEAEGKSQLSGQSRLFAEHKEAMEAALEVLEEEPQLGGLRGL